MKCSHSSLLLIMLMLISMWGLNACASVPTSEIETSQVSKSDTENGDVRDAISDDLRDESSAQTVAEPTYSSEVETLLSTFANGDNEATQALARTIIETDPTHKDAAIAMTVLGMMAYDQWRYEEAKLYVERATEIDPKFPIALYVLARIARAQELYNDALSYYARAQELTQEALPYIEGAAILLNFLDTKRALEWARAAYERENDNCNAIAIYGDAQFANKQFEGAINAYEAYDSQEMHCATSEKILQNMAKIYEVHLLDKEKSCKIFDKLLNLKPEDKNYRASRDFQCQP